MKALLWFAAIVIVFGAVATYELKHFSYNPEDSNSGAQHVVEFNDTQVHVTLARTSAEQEKGLSGRDSLDSHEGMLFVFEKDGTYGFWMKDMKFSIDIIWLAVDGTVVDIAERVAPNTYPQSFGPKVPARFVLEVPAGFVLQNMVRVGDIAKLP